MSIRSYFGGLAHPEPPKLPTDPEHNPEDNPEVSGTHPEPPGTGGVSIRSCHSLASRAIATWVIDAPVLADTMPSRVGPVGAPSRNPEPGSRRPGHDRPGSGRYLVTRGRSRRGPCRAQCLTSVRFILTCFVGHRPLRGRHVASRHGLNAAALPRVSTRHAEPHRARPGGFAQREDCLSTAWPHRRASLRGLALSPTAASSNPSSSLRSLRLGTSGTCG